MTEAHRGLITVDFSRIQVPHGVPAPQSDSSVPLPAATIGLLISDNPMPADAISFDDDDFSVSPEEIREAEKFFSNQDETP